MTNITANNCCVMDDCLGRQKLTVRWVCHHIDASDKIKLEVNSNSLEWTKVERI